MAADPELVIVQASSRSWAGGRDYSVAPLDGRPAVAWTLDAALARFPAAPVAIAAPAFDRGGALDAVSAEAGARVSVFYGFDDSPLARLVAVTSALPEAAYVIRVDGLHFGADLDAAGDMLAIARAESLDCVKAPDDFPAQLTADVYRVGALRRAARLLAGEESPFLVHPKFFMLARPGDFRARRHEGIAVPGDDRLAELRSRAARLVDLERQPVDARHAIRHGDQLAFHYELALRWVPRDCRLLDVACGTGWGARRFAGHCREVHGVDLDAPSIAEARADPLDGLTFHVADCAALPFPDGHFDAILSMETFEHVELDPFLQELERVLAPGGVLVASTPQNRLGHIPITPAHRVELSAAALEEAVHAHFAVEELIGLKAGTISFPGDPLGSNSVIVARRR